MSTATNFDPLVDELPSRYIVGIDLGTTNSAVTFVDTNKEPWQVQVFSLPQLVALGEVEQRETLPSFHFQAAPGEESEGGFRLPWSNKSANANEPNHAVGMFARDRGVSTPSRLIASAKSWLCHSGVDRTAPLLPWQGAADVDKLSPVDVSSRYLAHIREAWDAKFKRHPLSEQDIVLTLPASFDEVARELTVEAAAQAGLRRVVLIEEPQAAFYSWVYRHTDDWETLVEPGQKILVCDIGGGTSDFTLIRVRAAGGKDAEGKSNDNTVQFHRVAVGEHLILGGDNLDLALATHVEKKLTNDGKLEPRQWDVLVRTCRGAKETLLGENAPDEVTINLPGSGSKLIGGGVRATLTREEAHRVLVDGFFPEVELDAQPTGRVSGFQEFGLPYASDPGITRYLASFLSSHRHVAMEDAVEGEHDPARPDIVLFNGGVLESTSVRERLIETITNWFRSENDSNWSPQVLENDRLDLSVAQGASYYGMVRRGVGVRIAASLARTYYIGVESEPPSAVCLMPGNAEPGETVDLESPAFELMVSEPVEFPLFISSTRLTDQPGEVIPIDLEQMRTLPPIRTVLKTRSKNERGLLEVGLHAKLTEIGTIDLWCAETVGERSWRLQFDVRSATQTDVSAHQSSGEEEGVLDEENWRNCQQLLEDVFGEAATGKPAGLAKQLAKTLELPKHEWPTSVCRRIWESLLELERGRRRSPAHEARWLNLLGYGLRPGYGLAVDDWRVAETWRTVQGKLAHGAADSQSEANILWRRVSGGLSAGQQKAIAEPLIKRIQSDGIRAQESVEVWRLLGSLELLPTEMKLRLGRMLTEQMGKRKMAPARSAMVWALGRLGQRTPLYGPLNTVTPSEQASDWLRAILGAKEPDAVDCLAVMEIARKTGDRYRDLDEADRQHAAKWLASNNAPEHFVELVTEGGELDAKEQGQVFGEALPKGLRIVR